MSDIFFAYWQGFTPTGPEPLAAPAHSAAMGQKDGEKWTAAVDLQPTIPKSDRLLDMQDQSTPIAAVPLLAAYQPAGARKAGMMMYSLALDVQPVTGQARFSWAQMVHEAMARKPPAAPGKAAGPA